VNKEEDMEVVGTSGCGKEGIARALETQPHIVVLDLAIPDIRGFEIARILRKELPETQIAALTMYLDRRMIYEALKEDMRAYILKEASPQEFISALRVLTAGEIYLSPKVATVIVTDYMRLMGKSVEEESATTSPSLSVREKEVLKLLVQGKSTRCISETLHISKSTVDTHRRNILDKVGCENVSYLIRYALREGLVDLAE
jgi:DNA-binding NarL/FixJ family response regulator